nr:unnamed protein product [Spirometra erinaceieuropaei]
MLLGVLMQITLVKRKEEEGLSKEAKEEVSAKVEDEGAVPPACDGAILLLGVLVQVALAKSKKEEDEDLSKDAKGEVVAKEDEGAVSPACGGVHILFSPRSTKRHSILRTGKVAVSTSQVSDLRFEHHNQLVNTIDLAVETIEILMRDKYNETENHLRHIQFIYLL